MTQPNGTAQAGRNRGRKEVKMVIVGDGGCGKTSLLMVYAKGAFPETYAPSVFEKYITTITIGNKDVDLHLYDTAGQEDYDRLRPLSYQDVNLVLICYDVTSPSSFDNVLIKWYPEVHHFCRGVPIILIGCKTDLRKDKERVRKLKTSQQEPITYSQIRGQKDTGGRKLPTTSPISLCQSNEHHSSNTSGGPRLLSPGLDCPFNRIYMLFNYNIRAETKQLTTSR
uniref:Ras homolog family member F, filopodia associated n=1 Tax=Leptobrachium leishanense TaxID=445787 RepID=A0A8C5LQ05_9ANUR